MEREGKRDLFEKRTRGESGKREGGDHERRRKTGGSRILGAQGRSCFQKQSVVDHVICLLKTKVETELSGEFSNRGMVGDVDGPGGLGAEEKLSPGSGERQLPGALSLGMLLQKDSPEERWH